MIGLLELLRARGFTPQTNEAKLIRHKGDNLNMEVLLRDGWFETYQSFQSKQVFEGCTHIVSFVGEESVLSHPITHKSIRWTADWLKRSTDELGARGIRGDGSG